MTLPGGAPAVFNLATGTLTVNANFTWSFAANTNLDSTPVPTVSFTVTATDGPGLSDDVVVTINVTDVNEAPVAPDDFSKTAAEDVDDVVTAVDGDAATLGNGDASASPGTSCSSSATASRPPWPWAGSGP